MGGKSFDTYDQVKVMCPFYKGEEAVNIHCEGLKRGGSVINHFASARSKELFMASHCHSLPNYPSCPICQMMTRVWQGDWRV